MTKLFFKCGAAFGALTLTLSPVRGGESLPFAEDVVNALEQTPLAKTLFHLEFHPVARGQRLGQQYPGLSGARLGPYECLARLPGADYPPGVYPFRVVISTKPTFYNAQGRKIELGKGATSKSERATEVRITPLPDNPASTGDKNAPPVQLREMLGGNENDILWRECLFLKDQPLRIGMPSGEVEAVLKPAAITRSEPALVPATGATEEVWSMPDLDLEITFTVAEKGGAKTVSSLRAGVRSPVETARGIRPGHPESRVRTAYQGEISKRDSTEGEMLIVGNMYLGLFVEIKAGKVGSLYLGTGAE